VFTDSHGATVRFGDLFDGKRPVVLILGYYDCPLLCTVVFNAAQKAFGAIDYRIGQDYAAVSVSFDHTNTTDQALMREQAMAFGLPKGAPAGAWRFLTSDASNVRRLADSVGYHYVYMSKADEYAHPSALVFLTPQGKVSGYLFGEAYEPKQLKLALIKASGGEMGSVFDKLLLHYCYVYDPASGSYTLQAMRVMQIASAGCVVLMGGFLGALFRQGRARRGRARREAAGECGAECGRARAHAVESADSELQEASPPSRP
jgi:protein SCO1/2